MVRGEINKKTADIQARTPMARTLEDNGKKCQADGEAKVVPMKNRNSIMPEDHEEFLALTLSTRNSKNPSRMIARNWKRRWLLLCPAKL